MKDGVRRGRERNQRWTDDWDPVPTRHPRRQTDREMMVKVQREYRVKTHCQGAAIEAVLWVDEEYRKGFRRIRLDIEDVTGENLNASKSLA